jgi:hemerythrin-like domain-containing protein
MSAMKKEAEDLLARKPLRPEFWSGVVDFIGNFVHRVHRAQEERFFFPKLIELGLIDARDREHLEQDHASLKQLTLALCDGVSEGDWEKALRTVSHYLHIIGPHLDAEEQRLESPVLRSLSDEQVKGLQQEFHSLARAASSETGRRHYLELTRNLCSQTGKVPAFDAD